MSQDGRVTLTTGPPPTYGWQRPRTSAWRTVVLRLAPDELPPWTSLTLRVAADGHRMVSAEIGAFSMPYAPPAHLVAELDAALEELGSGP